MISERTATVVPPHYPLLHYYGDECKRPDWVCSLFDRTAADYDRLESIVGLGMSSRYRRRALRAAGLTRGMRVIDVGTGTGLLAKAAAEIAGADCITGIDPSARMLEHAAVSAAVRLFVGSAEAMPFAQDSADFLCMGYALRHLTDLDAAFTEFQRVIRPGGRLCLLEFSIPTGPVPRALLKAWVSGVMPEIARALGGKDAPTLMRYLWETIEASAPPQRIMQSLRKAGFVSVACESEGQVLSSYMARKPPDQARSSM